MSGNTIQSFIARWTAASASERANSQLFLSELYDVLEIPPTKRLEAETHGFFSSPE